MFEPKVKRMVIGSEFDDKDEIQIGDQKMLYREFKHRRAKLEEIKPKAYDLLCFWDDTVQITSLGILDYFVAKGLEQPDLSSIFQRSDRKTWEDAVFESIGMAATRYEFNEAFKKHYDEALHRAPYAETSRMLIMMDHIVEHLTLVFRTRTEGTEEILQHLLKKETRRGPIEAKYLDEISYETLIKNHKGNVICTETPGRALAVLLENKMAGKLLLAPYPHTDLPVDMMLYSMKIAEERGDNSIILPLATNLEFYEEKLYVI